MIARDLLYIISGKYCISINESTRENLLMGGRQAELIKELSYIYSIGQIAKLNYNDIEDAAIQFLRE